MESTADPSVAVLYCDHNATSPLRPEAREAMLPWLGEIVGNASSLHAAGRAARNAVEDAREAVAALVGARARQVVWTSGATEANNLGLKAALTLRPHAALVVSDVEHPSVRELTTVRQGSVRVAVDGDGRVHSQQLAKVLEARQGCVVSVMAANNETGVLNDVASLAEVTHKYGGVFHTDATQQAGRLPVSFASWDVDMMSISAHKFGGPQGVGTLVLARDEFPDPVPLFHGGSQERGWRSGTLNVAGIVGMGAAARAAVECMSDEARRVQAIRQEFEALIRAALPQVSINCVGVSRLPGVSSVTLPGAPADAVLQAMPDVCASEGSACASGAPGPSHVLLALGLDEDTASSTIRVSFGYTNSPSDASVVAGRMAAAYKLVTDLVRSSSR